MCLEVGAWCGYTTVCMAKTAEFIYSLDSHMGDMHTGRANTFGPFIDNLRRYRVLDRVAVLVGESIDILPRLPQDHFDLVFIDATHTYEAVLNDSELCWPLMKRGGYMCWHDYEEKSNPDFGVTKAVDEIRNRYNLENVDQVGTLLICKVPQFQL
jgi:predicted O-methyltransferase YrrM